MTNRPNPLIKHKPCFYRVSIKGVIHVNDKVVLTREHGSNRWDLPGGGVEHYEEPTDAFMREIKEELGVSVKMFDESNLQAWFTYDSDPDWDRPILYLVARADISGMPKAENGVDVGYFTIAELSTVALEKHLEKFRERMMTLAAGNNQ
jgi:8-oxo-dGTP pyrophosphatase MutT (NUDIX family)